MYEWEDDEGPSRGRAVLIGGVIVALAALGWFVVRPAISDDDNTANQQSIVFDTSGSSAPSDSGAALPESTAVATTEVPTTEGGAAVASTQAAVTPPTQGAEEASTSSAEPATTSSTST